jgi:hypothetical protein
LRPLWPAGIHAAQRITSLKNNPLHQQINACTEKHENGNFIDRVHRPQVERHFFAGRGFLFFEEVEVGPDFAKKHGVRRLDQ